MQRMVPPKSAVGEKSHVTLQGETASAGSSAEKGHAASYQASQVGLLAMSLFLAYSHMSLLELHNEQNNLKCGSLKPSCGRVTLDSSPWMQCPLSGEAQPLGLRAATACGIPPRSPRPGRLWPPSTSSWSAKRPPRRCVRPVMLTPWQSEVPAYQIESFS